MATEKYGFGNVTIGTTGWNGILDDNMDDIDAFLHTYLQVTLGESVGEGQPVCIVSGGTAKLARRGATSERKPAIGIAIENGLVTDEIRVRRVGEMTYAGWNFTLIGKPVYLGDTLGSLTQNRPANDIQMLGIAMATTTLLLLGNVVLQDYVAPSTTTTTTTTSTSTTTT